MIVKYLKIIKNIVYYLAIILLVLISLATASTVLDIPKGVKFLMVQSGSMEPAIKVGSVVIIGKSDEYKEGDIVTYLIGENTDLRNAANIITHRIVKISEEEGIVTKGDANDTPDSIKVTKDQIIGKVRFSLPFLGYGVSFAKSQTGFILLIIVPGTLIIYGELINIKNEILNIVEDVKKKKDEKKKKGKKKKTRKKLLLKQILVLFLLGFSSCYFASTKAYLTDTESNPNNVIQAGVWSEEELGLQSVGPQPLLVGGFVQTNSLDSEEDQGQASEEVLFFDTNHQLNLNQFDIGETVDLTDFNQAENE